MRPAMIAAIVAMSLFFHPAAAQSPPAAVAVPDQTAAPEAAPTVGGLLSHSALKAVTYKIATTASNFTILTVATGGMVAGAALTLFGAVASVAVYTVNDYAWERHAPPPPPKPDESQSFNLNDEFWRTSKKFLTYKAATIWIKAAKLAALYAYTGSPTTTLTAISASTAVNAGIFFANNFAWDYYDSLTVRGAAAVPPLRETMPPPEALPAPELVPPAMTVSLPVADSLQPAEPLGEAAPKS